MRSSRVFYPSTAPRPGLFKPLVSIVPSVMWKIPGNRSSQALLALGTYCLELASMAATVGTWAARPAEWMSDAPGQVRSCTRSEEHTSELQSRFDLVCRLLLEKKNKKKENK